MSHFQKEFLSRTAAIPRHGIGLSADVYSPDIFEMHEALAQAGLVLDYVEIFKARTEDLARIRVCLPDLPLTYHAEGLWLIDPAMRSATPWVQAVQTIARHAETIGAGWANHECAGKQFGGYSFGTYLPPLLTDASARAVAANAALAQDSLDEWFARKGKPGVGPLLLLELPPLTYFGFGDLPVSEFFARIVEQAPCGLVLDIGHLWTHWRYRERRRCPSLDAFTAEFLNIFPLERVVQIHLAGLGRGDHETVMEPEVSPWWVDAHASRVPPVLWDLLRQVLAHPGLTSLKGIALEVDTKAVPLIVEEFGRLREEPACRKALPPSGGEGHPGETHSRHSQTRLHSNADGLADQYRTYARAVSGEEPLPDSALASLAECLDREGLSRYRMRYLPHELLRWGGDLEELFPAIWSALNERGISARDFVRFWFRTPSAVSDPYDFFYIKLERWEAFVREVAPDLSVELAREAGALRTLHAELNDEPTGTPFR